MKSWWLKAPDNFVFLDTEGQDILREIVLVDYQGKLIYQAFVKDHYNNTNIRVKLKTLTTIIEELKDIFSKQIKSKTIVCHNAEHDRKILINSFQQENLKIPPLRFSCTIKLAQQCYPQSSSYSLGYLAKQLRLKFKQQLFREKQAHTAYYDAQFTRKLFFHLTNIMSAKSNINQNQ